MQQFYHPDLHPECDFAPFDREESKHIIKVLRKKHHDQIALTDGNGKQYQGLLEVIDSKSCGVRISKVTHVPADNYQLHIAIAPTKKMDRLEWFVEKATEIGIHKITPILCQQSERKTVKTERLQKIAVSAMKQSMGAYLPKINPLTDYKKTLDSIKGFCAIAHCHKMPKTLLHQVSTLENEIHVFIGPEGDFTEEEVSYAQAKSVIPVSLGHKRLRTETAALVTCQTIALLHA